MNICFDSHFHNNAMRTDKGRPGRKALDELAAQRRFKSLMKENAAKHRFAGLNEHLEPIVADSKLKRSSK